MKEILKYISNIYKNVDQILTGLKFALSSSVSTEDLNKKNIQHEVDGDGVMNIVINPIAYPNTKESYKIPNIKEYVTKTLSKNVTLNINDIVQPGHYTNDYVENVNNSTSYIFNPTSNNIKDLLFRNENTVLNYKSNNNESSNNHVVIVEGSNDNAIFINHNFINTLNRNETFNKNVLLTTQKYNTSIHNSVVGDRNINKIYKPYSSSLPIVEYNGAVVSAPYGIVFDGTDDYQLYKSDDKVYLESKKDIVFKAQESETTIKLSDNIYLNDKEFITIGDNININNTLIDTNIQINKDENVSLEITKDSIILKDGDKTTTIKAGEIILTNVDHEDIILKPETSIS